MGSYVTTTCNIDESANAGVALDPEFVDPSSDDYHLEAGSPGIDACDTGHSVDIDGNSRPFGEKYDMGSFEYNLYKTYLPLLIKNG
jgi:hypothetical protein